MARTSPQGKRRITVFFKGKREFASIWDRWQNDEKYMESQVARVWSDAWMRYSDHIVHIDISQKAPHEQRDRHKNLLDLRSVDENKQAPLLSQKPGTPSSSSPASPSSTWWSSSSWSPSWQRWHQHSWQDDKWSEQR